MTYQLTKAAETLLRIAERDGHPSFEIVCEALKLDSKESEGFKQIASMAFAPTREILRRPIVGEERKLFDGFVRAYAIHEVACMLIDRPEFEKKPALTVFQVGQLLTRSVRATDHLMREHGLDREPQPHFRMQPQPHNHEKLVAKRFERMREAKVVLRDVYREDDNEKFQIEINEVSVMVKHAAGTIKGHIDAPKVEYEYSGIGEHGIDMWPLYQYVDLLGAQAVEPEEFKVPQTFDERYEDKQTDWDKRTSRR